MSRICWSQILESLSLPHVVPTTHYCVVAGELSSFALRELPPGSTGVIGYGSIGPSREDISSVSPLVTSYRYNSELLSVYTAPACGTASIFSKKSFMQRFAVENQSMGRPCFNVSRDPPLGEVYNVMDQSSLAEFRTDETIRGSI